MVKNTSQEHIQIMGNGRYDVGVYRVITPHYVELDAMGNLFMIGRIRYNGRIREVHRKMNLVTAITFDLGESLFSGDSGWYLI